MPLLGFVELPSNLRVMVVLVVVVDQTGLRCTITILETTLGRRGGGPDSTYFNQTELLGQS